MTRIIDDRIRLISQRVNEWFAEGPPQRPIWEMVADIADELDKLREEKQNNKQAHP